MRNKLLEASKSIGIGLDDAEADQLLKYSKWYIDHIETLQVAPLSEVREAYSGVNKAAKMLLEAIQHPAFRLNEKQTKGYSEMFRGAKQQAEFLENFSKMSLDGLNSLKSEGGPVPDIALHQFISNLGKLFLEVTGRKPAISEHGQFADFVNNCLDTIDPDEEHGVSQSTIRRGLNS